MSQDNNTETTDEAVSDASTPAATATAQRDEGSEADAEGAIDTERPARKVREGVVTSAGMDKTIVVTVTDRVRHARYNKFVLRSKRLYTHDETNDAGEGDKVRVMETRPLSKNKRWRLVEIVERAR